MAKLSLLKEISRHDPLNLPAVVWIIIGLFVTIVSMRLGEKFTFRLDFGNKGNIVSVDFHDDEVMRVSFTDPWPVYGGALTPEHIAYENSTWQTKLTEVMEVAEVPEPHTPDEDHHLFRYASFITEATLRLGTAREPSDLFDQDQEYVLDMIAKNQFMFKVSTKEGRTFVEAKYGIDIPVVHLENKLEVRWRKVHIKSK